MKTLLFKNGSNKIIRSQLRLYSLNASNIVSKGIAQATVEKGISDWNPDLRPLYLDSQVFYRVLKYKQFYMNYSCL